MADTSPTSESFGFEGREIPIHPGDTIGSALYRAGRRHRLALLQVPPPPRLPVHERRLPELPRAGRRRDRRALLHAPGLRRHEGRAPERHGLARARPARAQRHAADAQVPAGRLLLQDADQAELGLAQGRAADPQGRRPRQGRQGRPPAPPRARLPPPRRGRARRRPGRTGRGTGRGRGGRLGDRGRRGRASRQPARCRRDARRGARPAHAGRGEREHRAAARAPRIRALRGPRGAADRPRPARDDAAEGDRRRDRRVRVDGGLPRQRRARRDARARRGAPRHPARDQARQGRRRPRRDARGRRAHRGPAGRRHGGRRRGPARRRDHRPGSARRRAHDRRRDRPGARQEARQRRQRALHGRHGEDRVRSALPLGQPHAAGEPAAPGHRDARARGRRPARRRPGRRVGRACARGRRAGRARRGRRAPRARPEGPALRRGRLRLHLRGRLGAGRAQRRHRGLLLDRAAQALHDDHDGPLPGPHVPRPDAHARRAPLARRRAAHLGHDDRPPAGTRGDARRGHRRRLRAPRAPHGAARHAPRPRRHVPVGRPVEARRQLRLDRAGVPRGARGRRHHRRRHARQVPRLRARRRRVPRAPLPEPRRRHPAGAPALRAAARRARRDPRRRHDLPHRRGDVLPHGHDLGRRGGRGADDRLARHLGHDGAHRQPDLRARRDQHRRPEGARGALDADRGRHQQGGLPLPPPAHDHGGRDRVPRDPPRLRGRGRLGAPPRGLALRGAVGRAAEGRRGARRAAVRHPGPAPAAAREGPHHRLAGHRLRDDAVARRHGLGGQAREGLVRRQARARAQAGDADREADRLSRRERLDQGALGGRGGQGRRASSSAASRARGTPGRSAIRSAWPGSSRSSRTRASAC